MRHSLAFALALLVFSGTGVRAQDDNSISYSVIGVAKADKLQVRQGPGKSYEPNGAIPPNGQGIEFLGVRKGTWMLVRYRPGKGRSPIEGYVHADYLIANVAGWCGRNAGKPCSKETYSAPPKHYKAPPSATGHIKKWRGEA